MVALPVTPLPATSAAAAVPPPAAMPEAEAAGRFEAALTVPHAVEQLAASPGSAGVGAPELTPGTLGERILATFDQMRDVHRTKIGEMTEMLVQSGTEKPSLPDLMLVFLEVQRLTMTEQMMAQLVGKTTQNLDTLLKAQ
jgi:hypothetical protein